MATLPSVPFVSIDSTRVAVDAPVSTDLMTDIAVNLNYLKAGVDAFSGITQVVFTGTSTWLCPAGITQVLLEMFGGGGGGGGGGGTGQNPGVSGGGGGGGAWVRKTYAVTPGVTYTVTIGAAGGGGNGATSQTNGANGTDTWFDISSNKAVGGSGGSSASNGGTGGGGGAGATVGGSVFSVPGQPGGDQAGGVIGAAGAAFIYGKQNPYGNGGNGGLVNTGGVTGGNGAPGTAGLLLLSF